MQDGGCRRSAGWTFGTSVSGSGFIRVLVQANNALKMTASPTEPESLLSESGLQISTGPRYPPDLRNPCGPRICTKHRQVSPSFTDRCVCGTAVFVFHVVQALMQRIPQRSHKLTPAVHLTLHHVCSRVLWKTGKGFHHTVRVCMAAVAVQSKLLDDSTFSQGSGVFGLTSTLLSLWKRLLTRFRRTGATPV